MLSFDLNNLIQTIHVENENNIFPIDVLRLDCINDAVSGNKWFKLQYFIKQAISLKAKQIVTYGGVWSNHVAATAAACKAFNIPSKAFIRSDESLMTETLRTAQANSMEIIFCSREMYKLEKKKIGLLEGEQYYIPEGGANALGVKGAMEILSFSKALQYSHIICSLGTGTTFAGIVNASSLSQKIIGINALKGGFVQYNDIQHLLRQDNWEIKNDYHFGGFAKYDKHLTDWMNQFYEKFNIPTDIVYTSKMFYGVLDLIAQHHFSNTDNILVIHSGGLQGNQSLTKAQLIF